MDDNAIDISAALALRESTLDLRPVLEQDPGERIRPDGQVFTIVARGRRPREMTGQKIKELNSRDRI